MANKTTSIPGIYEIWVKNTKHFYIGSSCKCINHRFRQHKYLLNKGIHYNKQLQNCFNKYGEESLVFNIVEELLNKTKDEILSREKFWIERQKPDLNIQKDPTQFYLDNSGEKHGFSKSTNKQISIIKGLMSQGLGAKDIKNLVDLSSYYDPRGLISGIRHHNRWSEVEIHPDYLTIYELISPNNKKFLTTNLHTFKRKNDLPWEPNTIYNFISEKIGSKDKRLHGWECKVIKYPELGFCFNPKLNSCKVSFGKLIPTKKENAFGKDFLYFNYLGCFGKIRSLVDFCVKNNLNKDSLLNTRKNSTKKHHFGFTLREPGFKGEVCIIRYKISTPEGRTIYCPDNNLCTVSKNLGLAHRRLSYVYKSKNTVKGWKVKKEKLTFEVSNTNLIGYKIETVSNNKNV